MTKRNHDGHQGDAARDALAIWRATLREDERGIAVLLRSSSCRRCLVAYLVGAGMTLASGTGDTVQCECGSGDWRFTGEFCQAIDAKLSAMLHTLLHDGPLPG